MTAHKARDDWYRQQYPTLRNRSPKSRRITRALRLASQAQYTRAMRTLSDAPIADLNDPNTHAALSDLHLAPASPITPLNLIDLPLPPEVQESEVLRAVNPNSAPGPDRMSPRSLHLLVTSPVKPRGRGHRPFCSHQTCSPSSAQGIPAETLPLLAAATLLPIRPRPNKIRQIAIGQTIRRLVAIVVLPKAISDSNHPSD